MKTNNLLQRKKRVYRLYFDIIDKKDNVSILNDLVDDVFCGGLNKSFNRFPLWYINDVFYKMHKDYLNYNPYFDDIYEIVISQKSKTENVNYIYVG